MTADASRPVEDSSLALAGHRFALARPRGHVPRCDDGPSGPATRPFALRFAQTFARVEDMTLPSFQLCPERQIAIDTMSGVPLFHTMLVQTTTGVKDGKDPGNEEWTVDR